jgi:hypothetical protein
MASKVKLTEARKRILSQLATGGSISDRDCRLAYKMEALGLLRNGRVSVAFEKTFTFYDLTPAGRAHLASSGKTGE